MVYTEIRLEHRSSNIMGLTRQLMVYTEIRLDNRSSNFVCSTPLAWRRFENYDLVLCDLVYRCLFEASLLQGSASTSPTVAAAENGSSSGRTVSSRSQHYRESLLV